jgi:uncharacterized protein YfbU (UPF0304 family)
MASKKWGIKNNKYISIFLQIIFLLFYASFVNAEPTCSELVKNLQKEQEFIASNGGMWRYVEKDPALRNHSGKAIQLDSRISKIFFTLEYLCKTQHGIPLNDLAVYLSGNLIKKSEDVFKDELRLLGKTNQEINTWFKFLKYAQKNKSRTLKFSEIQDTINQTTPLIKKYTQLPNYLTKKNSTQFLRKKINTLLVNIDYFLSSNSYIAQALEEMSNAPYWDINESVGGS